jgi:hypothetical protein
LLAPIYGWFTEGVDTADLQDAKALLEELAEASPAVSLERRAAATGLAHFTRLGLHSTRLGYRPSARVIFIPETASRRSTPWEVLVRSITTPCSLRIMLAPAPPPMVAPAAPAT